MGLLVLYSERELDSEAAVAASRSCATICCINERREEEEEREEEEGESHMFKRINSEDVDEFGNNRDGLREDSIQQLYFRKVRSSYQFFRIYYIMQVLNKY